MGMARKLDGVLQNLALLAEPEKAKGFLNGVGNANKLGGLLEDIRDAMMDYRVCTSPDHLAVFDVRARFHYNNTFTTRAVSPS